MIPYRNKERKEHYERKFRSTPETFQNTQESSGNIPEKTDKEKKIKEKQNKENSSSTPPQPSGALTEEEARVLLSSTVLGEDRSSKPDIARHQPPQADAKAEEEKQRNPQGLINTLRPYNLSQRELEEVLQLSRHGEIGNPVWSILAEMHGNKRLKMPRLFLLKRLRDAMGLVAGGSPGGKATEAS